MRWLMNGIVSGGGTLSQYVDETVLLHTSLAAAREQPRVKRQFAGGVGKNDPVTNGWLLVVPDDDEGRRIVTALAPLIERRAGATRRPEDVIRYFPADAATQPKLGEWFQTQIAFPASGDIDDDQPFYVLLGGSPAKIPFELDHLLSAGDSCVGRLAFPETSVYEAYAKKVVGWEPPDDAALSPRGALPVGVFATDHGFDDPTHLSRKYLAEGLLDWLQARDPTRRRFASIGDDATRSELLRMLRGEPTEFAGPRLLFSATHGLAVPGQGEARRAARMRHQGAVCCQDAMYVESEILGANALDEGAMLRGGVWMLFACFGAGTPAASDFMRVIDDRSLSSFHDGGPFIAALPTRLLANPDGPLAVIGHIDPGFVNSFSDPGRLGGERRVKIHKTIKLLLDGLRVGQALSPLSGATNAFRAELLQTALMVHEQLRLEIAAPPTEIGAALAKRGGDPEIARLSDRLIDLATSLNDFRNFTILGDPAVKLPREGAEPARASTIISLPAAARVDASADRPSRPEPPGVPAPIAAAKREDRLIVGTAEQLFSADGVSILPAGETVITLVAPACTDVAAVHERPEGEPQQGSPARRYYEAVEHQDCDLTAELRYPAGEVHQASRHRLLLANGVSLRYGEAISLFADFYAIPGVRIGDGEPAFLRVFETFEHGDAGEMCRILGAMKKEREVVQTADEHGGSVANAYARASGALNGDYNRATGGGSFISALFPRGRFLELASVNFDHFGEDAVAAYRAAHSAACRAAEDARALAPPDEQRRALDRAYVINACADHFLTDLFAAGHLRVPRRELHERCRIQIVGDLLAKRMHDEDNALGLAVRNRRGDEWRAYGDQHFHAQENEAGRELAREAVRISVAEVWTAFERGSAPGFAALDIVPDVPVALTSTRNHSPLFLVEGGVLKVRARPLDPGCSEHTSDLSGLWILLQAAVRGGP